MRQITAVFASVGLLAVVAGCSARVPGLTYASFLQEIEAENVSDVEFSSGRAIVRLKAPIPVERTKEDFGGVLVYQVEFSPDEEVEQDLIDLLKEREVPFSLVGK